MWLSMFFLFVGRELYGFLKIKFGKVGKQLEALDGVPKQIEEMAKNHEELSLDIRALTKAMNQFEREVHKQIRDEVKYSIEMLRRRQP